MGKAMNRSLPLGSMKYRAEVCTMSASGPVA